MRDGEEDGAVNDWHIRTALQRAHRVIGGFGAHLGAKRQSAALARLRAIFRDLDLLEPLPVPGAPTFDHRPYAFAVVKKACLSTRSTLSASLSSDRMTFR